MTLKISRAREELYNWSRQATVPLYFNELADIVMIKLSVANWETEWKQAKLQEKNP